MKKNKKFLIVSEKIFLSIFMIFALSLGFNINTARADCKSDILGIPMWHKGLTDGSCNIKKPESLSTFTAKVAMNIVNAIFSVAFYFAGAFVIYGGFKYMISQGNPGDLAGAKKTIANALIGMIICGMASVIIGLIGESLK